MSRFTFGADAARCLQFWRKLGCWFAIGLTTIMSCAATPHAIQFTFDYSGDTGEGFNDPANGQMRRTALEFAANIWGALLPAAYPGETIGIRAVVNPIGDATSMALASAGSNLIVKNFGSSRPEYQTDTYYAQSLANHLKGSDLDPAEYEIGITFNSNVGTTGALADRAWYYGTDGALPANTPTTFYRDFVTVALHEIGHGLGFSSLFKADGTYDTSQQYPAIYDRFLTFGPGGTPLPEMSPSGRALALSSDNLFWDGDAGRAANGGMPVKMYAPTTYDDSSTSHIDETTFPDGLLSPIYSGVLHVPGAIERGILRDMGWDVPIDVQWTGAGPNNAASTAANWSPSLPVAGDNLVFGSAPQTNVNFDLEIDAVGSLTFAAAAPSYTVTLRGWSDVEVNGAGVSNSSGNLQTIALEPGQDSNVPGASAAGARLAFNNSANSGSVTYEVRGGASIPGNIVVGMPMIYHRYSGAHAEFNDNATAGDSKLNVEGASGNGAPGTPAHVDFRDNSSAANAQIWNKGGRIGGDFGGVSISGWGGQTNFYDQASAGSATFRNDGENEYVNGTGGLTTFFGNSTAANATFINNGAGYANGSGGATQFVGNSTAASSNLTNFGGSTVFGRGGQTTFGDTAKAGTATINNSGPVAQSAYSGRTLFFATSSADHATITNLASSGHATTTDFYASSTGGSATIVNKSGAYPSVAGITTFHDTSSAGNATLTNDTTLPSGIGEFVFEDSSSAGNGTFTNGPYGGIVTFNDTSTAGQAHFTLRSTANGRINFFADSSAGSAHIDVGPVTPGPTNEFNDVNFYQNSTAANATITVRGDGGRVNFANGSAGNATIDVLGSTRPGNVSGTIGGQVVFDTGSDGGTATVTAQASTVAGAPGGLIQIHNSGHLGSATLIANGGATAVNGGRILFGSAGAGDSARLVVNAGASADFSLNAPHGGTTVGSIEGAGNFYLGASLLTVGNRNTSTTVSGTISNVGGSTAGVGGMLSKVGTGTLTLSGANTYTGLTTVAAGTLVVNGSIPGGVVVKTGATIKGTGTIVGTVACEGGSLCAFGNSPGTITVGGLNLMSGSTLEYEFGATRDRIVLTNNGSVTLGGLLDLSILAGFNPAPGETFQLFEGAIGSVTGAFSAINAPIFNGHTLDLVYSANQVTLKVIDAILPPGDYSLNGIVDAADYTIWRDNFGSGTSLPNDPSSGVGNDDYLRWKSHFGEATGSGASAAVGPAVPEPTALALVIAALFCLGTWRCASPRPMLQHAAA
jgi:autotransporter-associated beta strand protein